jgi:putative oxidoreductase
LLSQGESQGRTHLFDFFKNFGLAGGFLLLVLATQFQTLSDFAHTPLQSAPREAVSHSSPPTTGGQR